MTAQPPTPSGSPVLRAIASFLRFLLRLLLVVVVIMLLGAGLYYGVPWAHRNLVQPVQDTVARVAVLEQRMDLEEEHLQERNRQFQERIATLETELTELREEATVQAQDQRALQERNQRLEDRIAQLEGDLEGQRRDIEATAEEMRSELEGATADLDEQIEDLQERLEDALADLEERVEGNEGQLDDLSVTVSGLAGRLTLLQTAQDLVKVRMLLLEENPGAARETLALAIAHLEQASPLLPEHAETLDELRERMAAVDDLIATRSFRARPNLEALWADVMDLAAPVTSRSAITATQATSPLPTPTPSP